MDDVDPEVSKLILAHALLSAGLNLASSARERGARRTAVFFAPARSRKPGYLLRSALFPAALYAALEKG